MNIRFLRIAQDELDNAVEYYNNESLELGFKLLGEVFAAIDRIKEYPEAWSIFHNSTRRCLVRRFPYGVIYKHIDNVILIVAIANLHRKPENWIKRASDY